MRGSRIKKIIIFVVLAGLVVGYFIYLTHRKIDNTDKLTDENSVAYEVLNRDLTRNYPATPKAVVTYYGDIIKILYKEELTEDEFSGIVDKLRGIYDDKLLAYNSLETYTQSLQTEVEEYKSKTMYVSEFMTEDGYGIEYKTSEGDDYAFVDAKLWVRVDSTVSPIYEEFSLRKDADGNWKIVTWYSVDSSVMD